jgi:hypothetical protein
MSFFYVNIKQIINQPAEFIAIFLLQLYYDQLIFI